jgi:hypothetical protein
LPPVVPDTPQPEPIIEYSTPAPTETEHSLQGDPYPCRCGHPVLHAPHVLRMIANRGMRVF